MNFLPITAQYFYEKANSAKELSMTTLLTEKQAARLLNMSHRTLQRRRCDGKPPVYLSLNGTIRYRYEDLQQYAEGSVVVPRKKGAGAATGMVLG